MTTEDIAQEVARLVAFAGKAAADLVRVEEDRLIRGGEALLTEAVEPADCCPTNLATSMVLRATDRSLRRSETIRRFMPDRSLRVVLVEYCPFCGVRYHPVTDP